MQTTRLAPIPRDLMTEAQRTAADELTAGPRKGVKGPFIALMRSPELMARLQKVGEFLRFQSSLSPRLSEFATLVVSRPWTQQFEWAVHVPLALKAGTAPETVAALHDGRRPSHMADDEAVVYDFITELVAHKGVCDVTYQACVGLLGEHGVVELTALAGYFVTMAMVLNVARTPAEADAAISGVQPLPAWPL